MRRSKRNASQNTVPAAITISDLPNHTTCHILSRLHRASIFICKLASKIWCKEDNVRRSKRNTSQNTGSAATTYSDLPNHITCDILSRLPLTSIFRCKQVCKIWRDLIQEPYFAKLHLSRSLPSLIFYRNGNNNNSSSSSHFEILQLHDSLILSPCNGTMKFSTEMLFPHMRTQIEASCNGSILLSNGLCDDDRVIIACNPLRAHHFVLPKPPELALKTPKSVKLGFGRSPSTDQYKVLRINSTYRPVRFYFDIYTIGIDDEWRSIEVTGQPPVVIICQIIFLNGALHWIGVAGKSRFIYYFDLEKEHLGSFPLPCYIGNICNYLWVVDNRLYLHDMPSVGVWRFWAMKDYGDFGSWTLEWVIEEPINCRFVGFVYPLKNLKDGSLLIMFKKRRLKKKSHEDYSSILQSTNKSAKED